MPANLPGREELPPIGHKAVLFSGQPDSAGRCVVTSSTLLKCLASVKMGTASDVAQAQGDGPSVPVSASGSNTRSRPQAKARGPIYDVIGATIGGRGAPRLA